MGAEYDEERPLLQAPGSPDPADGKEEDDKPITIRGLGGSLLCHPQRIGHRLLMLFFMCMLGFGKIVIVELYN